MHCTAVVPYIPRPTISHHLTENDEESVQKKDFATHAQVFVESAMQDRIKEITAEDAAKYTSSEIGELALIVIIYNVRLS